MEFDWTAYWAAIPVTADELDSTNENEDFAGGYEAEDYASAPSGSAFSRN
jgi:hypothetical protein